MTRKTFARPFVLFALLAGMAGAQEAEPPAEPTLAFPAEVEQVIVDVVVIDKEGQPVTDLRQADVEIYEDGVRQGAVSFDMFEVAVGPVEAPAQGTTLTTPPAPPSRISTNADEEEAQGRTFVILFDDVHLTPYTAQQSKVAVREFLNTETRDGDRVTLVAPGSGAWWSTRMPQGREELLDMLERQQALLFPDRGKDRLSEYEAMRIHLFHDNMILNRVNRRYATLAVQTPFQLDKHARNLFNEEDPYVAHKAAETYYAATARNHVTLGAIERALNSLARIKGRKSLVLVSEGFIYDTHLSEFRRILTASRRANTAIYFVNSGGLTALPVGMDAEFSTILPQEDLGMAFVETYETAEGAVSIAADTGGFTVRDSNDLAGGLKRISDENRAYYLIGYISTNPERDGKFREIEVKIPRRKGIRIRARKGYYATSDEEVAATAVPGTDPVFQSALDSPYAVTDIGLRMTHFVREETFLDKSHVYVAAEVDVADLAFQEQEGREVAALQFLLVAVHRETGEFFRYDQKMDLRLHPETRARLSRTWLPIVREFELVPGHYRAKIVVRDKNAGRLASVDHDFEVPPPGQFRVSTPVLSDLRERTEDGVPVEQLAIIARRDFSPEGPLFCQLDVYGATKLVSSGMPRVTMGYEVRRSDGTLFTNEAPSEILPTSLGALSRLIGIPLESAAPGDYEIVMAVKDELSGSRVVLREPFHVTEAPPPSAPIEGAPAPGSTPTPAATGETPAAPATPAQASPAPSPTTPADTPTAPSVE